MVVPGKLPRLALLVLAINGAACGHRTLATDLDSAEAQRCAIALGAAGLDATVDRDEGSGDGRARVSLRGDDADYRSALQVLDEHALPHRSPAGFSASGSSLIPTPSEERAHYIKGLSGEIERMLESIDGVVSADVLVSLPERRPLTQTADEASASAVIGHSGSTSPVSPDEVRAIVVRAAGSSLRSDRVAVVLKPIVRSAVSRPIVRYQRDRQTEIAFGIVVSILVTAEAFTVWRLRTERRALLSKETGDA